MRLGEQLPYGRVGGTGPIYSVAISYRPIPATLRGQTQTHHLNRIRPSDWMIIFIHESIHSLDAALDESERVFARDELRRNLPQWARQTSDPTTLTPAQRADLEAWLIAGLNRGLWGRSSWLDRVLAQRGLSEGLDRFTYRFLDERSQSPTTEFFPQRLFKTLWDKFERGHAVPWAPCLGLEIWPLSYDALKLDRDYGLLTCVFATKLTSIS